MPAAADLVPGFTPETDLERALVADRRLLAGLAWGQPREGHPEGRVAAHVRDLLGAIDSGGYEGDARADLRVLALVHDGFKYRVREWLPKVGRNHHAERARTFAMSFTDDERLLSVLALHDKPYALWRRMRRRGRPEDAAFDRMMGRVADPALFLRFVELDGATEGKNPEPVSWFRSELDRRGILS